MTKVKFKTNIVLEYLEENADMPTLTLARTIFNENPELFLSVEQVRSTIRNYRGKSGKASLKSLKNKKFVETEPRPYNPFDLPDSDAEGKLENINLPFSSKKILCLFDIHLPFHDIDALTTAIKFGKSKDVDTIILGGDLLDFYSLSFYEKDPRKRNFYEELNIAKEFLVKLRKIFPTQNIYYLLGNHEERYMRYMKVKARELLGVKDFELDVLLDLKKLNINYIDGKRLINVGDTTIGHGHEFGQGFGSPVSPAKSLFNKAKANMIVGHSHVDSKHREKTIHGTFITTYSIGCLCELQPEYRPYNNYVHGFAYLEKDSTNKVSVQPYMIHEGKII